eukprot:scaffold1394_cov109-Isochrysis_galbana.AAC.6
MVVTSPVYEVKCSTSLQKSWKAILGSARCGGAPATMGHLFAFGSTEERLRVQVRWSADAAARRSSDPPFDHKTGQGRLDRGDYFDAIYNKKNKVVLVSSCSCIDWLWLRPSGASSHHRRDHGMCNDVQ